MRKGLLFVLLLILPLSMSWAERFRFKYKEGEKYRLLTEVNEDVYYNGVFSHRANILNKVAVETLMVKGDSGLLSATFLTSEFVEGVPRLKE